MKNLNLKNNILTKTYEFSDSLSLTPEFMRSYIKFFWYEIFNPITVVNSKCHLLILCKIGYTVKGHTEYKTLADLRRVNFEDKDLFSKYLIDRLGYLIDSYDVKTCNNITFTYIIKEGLADKDRLLLHPEEYKVFKHNFNSIKLPLSMVPAAYGVVLAEQAFDGFIRYVVKNDIRIYTIEVMVM